MHSSDALERCTQRSKPLNERRLPLGVACEVLSPQNSNGVAGEIAQLIEVRLGDNCWKLFQEHVSEGEAGFVVEE